MPKIELVDIKAAQPPLTVEELQEQIAFRSGYDNNKFYTEFHRHMMENKEIRDMIKALETPSV